MVFSEADSQSAPESEKTHLANQIADSQTAGVSTVWPPNLPSLQYLTARPLILLSSLFGLKLAGEVTHACSTVDP